MREVKKLINLKAERTVTVKNSNTILLVFYRACILNISKNIENLSGTQLIEMYRTVCPTTSEYTLFLGTSGTFTKNNHMLEYKANLSKFQLSEIRLYFQTTKN